MEVDCTDVEGVCRAMKKRYEGVFMRLNVIIIQVWFLVSFGLGGCNGGGGSSGSTGSGQDDLAVNYAPGLAASLEAEEERYDATSLEGESIGIILGDGSRTMVPELAQGYDISFIRRSTEAADTSALESAVGLVPTGATRELRFFGSGDFSALKPELSVPLEDAGSINLETVNVLRVGDVWVDGVLVSDQQTLLPVQVKEGALHFIDPLMRDGLQAVAAVSSATVGTQAVQYEWSGSARYILMSFQDDLNWAREPKLVRMIPDMQSESTGYRRPATESELEALNKQAICNVVLLVHGHNEEEKAGIYDTSAEAPWLFEYKRRVWDLFYREIMADEQNVPVYPYECTAFYEYIFPTYRPVFSPVSDKNGKRHETLGESLGKLVKEELAKNLQLKAMQDNAMHYNVFVISHSQGGLVARSGFRHMPDNFKSRIARFISWGTPHHGAALYSLRYALQAGFDMVVDGKRLPLQSIRNNAVTGYYLENNLNAKVALDAPGIRDLRWDASKKDLLNLRSVFPDMNDTNEGDIYPALYSENLGTFNDVIQSELSGLSTPYTFFYGITPKSAELELVDANGGWWFQYQAQQVYKFANSSSIEQGAALNRLLMASGYANSDGAVPVYSQQGAGIWGPENDFQSDMDHEEFYGSEPPARNAASIYKGVLTAQRTFEKSDLTNESRQCPILDAVIEVGAAEVAISGKLNLPAYEAVKKSPGIAIARIEARLGSQQGAVISALQFSYQSDGRFVGEGDVAAISGNKVAIVAVLKDGSEVARLLDYAGPAPYRWKEAIFTDNEKSWTQLISSDGRVKASTVWDDDFGTRHECELTIDWAMPATQDQPLDMKLYLTEKRNGEVYRYPYIKVAYLSYSSQQYEQSNGAYIARYGDVVDPSSTPLLSEGVYRRDLSYLADNILQDDFYYARRPSIYLELGLMCGSQEETWINLNYTTD
jgi:hypothetical protein